MRFLVGSVCAVIVVMVVSAPAARANDPGPPNSIVPTHIMLVGQSGGVSDPLGAFTVIIRDIANNPVPGSNVHVDFNVAPDARLSVVPGGPGLVVLCGPRQVRGISDAQGVVTFSILGGSRVGPASAVNIAKIYADGVLLGSIPVSSPDLDGSSGVGATDLAIWLQDFFSTASPTRSDFNNDGSVGGSDLAFWLQIFFNGGSAVSAPICP